MNVMLATMMISAALGADPDLQWETNYGVALKKARAEHRPLLVVMDTPNDPTNRMAQISFKKETTQATLLKTYTLCRIDVSTDYGQRVAKAYGAKQFPYTVITNSGATRITYRKAGQVSNEQWNRTLASHKSYSRVYESNSRSNATSSRGRICRT